MKNYLKVILTVLALLLGATAAHAAVDADITAMTNDATTVFTAVKAVKISVVGFLILLSFVKLVKGR